MAAPEHVPVRAVDVTRSYRSPDVVPEGWSAERPAALGAMQPSGGARGHQGPDQGYALRLVRLFRDRLHLQAGEELDDVEAGCVQVALKRASLFGRAPVVHDIEIACRVWGFLDEDCDPALVARRRASFEGAADRHHYREVRRLVASVPTGVLELSPAEVAARCERDWTDCLEDPTDEHA